MRYLRNGLLSVLGIVCLSGSLALGDPKVESTDIGVNGNAVGVSVGAHLKHYVVLAQKGSRYAVYVDGAEGPKIESMDWTGGSGFNAGGPWVGQIPVLFTPDGEHYTYCYKDGADTVIILDGKEIARGTMQPSLQMPLTFSRGGQHLAWGYDNCIYIDGKPGPKSRYAPQVYFSPDGSRYAYEGTEVGGNTQWAVVDGRQVNYFGEINQFSTNNHLISLMADPAGGASFFVLDGKPEFKAAGIGRVWTSPDGKQVAVQLTPAPNAKQVLTLNGNVVPGSEGAGVQNVYFSPDGKRYAVNCGQFMIVDGKKLDEYQAIPSSIGIDYRMPYNWAHPLADPATMPMLPAFTADSSKFVYVATAANKNYVCTEDGEYDDFTGGPLGVMPVLSASGGHYGFIGENNARKQAIVVDGKAQIVAPVQGMGQSNPMDLCFSPDGSHYVFISNNNIFYEDGKMLPGGISQQQYLFSPDGNHLVWVTTQSGVAIDGKILVNPGGGHNVTMPRFSPDSQHFYFVATGRVPNSTDTQTVYCDGKAVAHCSDLDGGLTPGQDSHLDVSSNGVLTFIARTDGELTKYVVTPDSNLDAALAAAKPVPATP